MRTIDRSSRILLAGAFVSVAVHAALAAGFVRWSENFISALSVAEPEAERPEEARVEPEAVERRPPVVRLGVERSEADTLAWLGFEKPTEHQAEQASVDQSAMTMAPPGPGLPEVEAPTPPVPEVPDVPPTPDLRALAEAAERVERTIARGVQDLAEQLAEAERRLARMMENLPAVRPDAAAREREAAEAAEREAALREAEAPRAAPPPPPRTNAPAAGSGLPGIQADKEAVAAAVKKAPAVKPGQVVAAEGLDIQTIQPRWSYTTLLTRNPRNPTVKITFGRDGAVRQAEFVSDGTRVYNSGYDDVDQPLLNAIYGWKARGKALAELSAEDPEAGVTVMITIILRG